MPIQRGPSTTGTNKGSFRRGSTGADVSAAGRYTDDEVLTEIVSPLVPGTTRHVSEHTTDEWTSRGIPASDIPMWTRRGFTPQGASRYSDNFVEEMRREEHQARRYLEGGIPPEKIGRWLGTQVSLEDARVWNDDPRPDRVAVAAASQGMSPTEHDAWVAALDTSMEPPDGMSAGGANAQADLASDQYDGWPARNFGPDEASAWWQGRHRVNCETADDLRALGVTPEAYNTAMDKEPYRQSFGEAPATDAERTQAIADHVKRVNGTS